MAIAATCRIFIFGRNTLAVSDKTVGSLYIVLAKRGADAVLIKRLGIALDETSDDSLGPKEERFSRCHPNDGCRRTVDVQIRDPVSCIACRVHVVHAEAYSVVASVCRFYEIGCPTRVVISVHVRVHRCAHTYLTSIEGVGHVVVGVVVGHPVVLKHGTLVGRLYVAYRTSLRLLRLLSGQGFIGIADTHGQSQTQRIGKLHPQPHLSTIDDIVVSQHLFVGFSVRSEDVDGVVQFGEEVAIDGLLAVIGCTEGSAAKVDIRNRPIHVGNAVERLHLDDVGQSSHLGHLLLFGFLSHFLPCRHHFGEGTAEHLVVPSADEAVRAIVYAIAPGASKSYVARERVGRKTLCHLVVGREAVARSIVEEHYAALHLREESAHVLIVALQVVVGQPVAVGVHIVEAAGTGCEKEQQ